MKILLDTVMLFLVYATIAYGMPHHELPPELKVAHETCLKKLEITNDDLFNGKRKGDSEKRNCFAACVFKERSMMTADGNWDKEKALTSFPPHVTRESAKKIVDTCFEQKEADDCETAAITQKCITGLVPHPPLPPHVQKMIDECKEELHLTDDDFEKLKSSTEDANAGCLMACFAKRSQWIRPDGSLNKDKIIENQPPHVSKELVEHAVEECGEKKGANGCETALLIQKCFEERGLSFDRRRAPPPEM